MTAAAFLIVTWSLLLAVFCTVHLMLLWRCLRQRALSAAWRGAALLPPATPLVAWRAGHRVLVVLWGLLLVAYVGARVMGPGLLSSAP